MRLHIHHYHHLDREVESRLLRLELKLDLVLQKQEAMMRTIDEVITLIREADTKQDSITALLVGLKQQVADLLSGTSVTPAVQAKIDEAFEAAKKNVAEIDEAIAANTPPTPNTPFTPNTPPTP